MIKGIGVDIVDIERFRKTLAKWQTRFTDRLFTKHEMEECLSQKDPAPHLAARFAAKEAFGKAIGLGLIGKVSPRDIEVIREPTGAPRLHIVRGALKRLEEIQATRVFLSLSHDGGIGIAMVVLENDM